MYRAFYTIYDEMFVSFVLRMYKKRGTICVWHGLKQAQGGHPVRRTAYSGSPSRRACR